MALTICFSLILLIFYYLFNFPFCYIPLTVCHHKLFHTLSKGMRRLPSNLSFIFLCLDSKEYDTYKNVWHEGHKCEWLDKMEGVEAWYNSTCVRYLKQSPVETPRNTGKIPFLLQVGWQEWFSILWSMHSIWMEPWRETELFQLTANSQCLTSQMVGYTQRHR